MGPIEHDPFYACAIYSGDFGTAGGVVTDEYARVLKPDGASIGAAFTFGWVAAHHATGSNELAAILA